MNKKEFETFIGLEVHAELNTQSKVFCGCKNAFGGEVNSFCCPVCTGMPGTLPTLNEQVVYSAIRMGIALNCFINKITKFDRKNYFYPDLPKAYQISQFDVPICAKGHLDVIVDDTGTEKRVGITRIHIEEDAGKLIHDDSFLGSLVDFNRCGVPLIEIVSEPDIRSSAEAKAYLDTIKSILQYLDISDCKMQEGSIRCDVNVSVRKKGAAQLGTRVEMKNVNSFSAAVRSIEYESSRQIDLLCDGGIVFQETRRWDDIKGENFVLRSKEDAHDYRYFPEPDLLTLVVPDEKIKELESSLPELPNKRMMRYLKEYGLSRFDAGLLIDNICKGLLFEEVVSLGASPKGAANWLNGDIARLLGERSVALENTNLSKEGLFSLLQSIDRGLISNTAGKIVLEEIMFSKKTVDEVISEKGLVQVSDEDTLNKTVMKILLANQKAIGEYKAGKTNVLGFLVGQCLRETQGKGNPAILRDLIVKAIDENN